MAYYHVTRDANCVLDDMARRALEVRAIITFWDGQVPEDAPDNQLQDVYEQQGIKPWLDWASLPKPFEWMSNQPDPQPDTTVAPVFGQSYTARVAQLSLWEARCKAVARLCEVAKLNEGLLCPADYTMGMAD